MVYVVRACWSRVRAMYVLWLGVVSESVERGGGWGLRKGKGRRGLEERKECGVVPWADGVEGEGYGAVVGHVCVVVGLCCEDSEGVEWRRDRQQAGRCCCSGVVVVDTRIRIWWSCDAMRCASSSASPNTQRHAGTVPVIYARMQMTRGVAEAPQLAQLPTYTRVERRTGRCGVGGVSISINIVSEE